MSLAINSISLLPYSLFHLPPQQNNYVKTFPCTGDPQRKAYKELLPHSVDPRNPTLP
jgi:hypothetical protein